MKSDLRCHLRALAEALAPGSPFTFTVNRDDLLSLLDGMLPVADTPTSQNGRPDRLLDAKEVAARLHLSVQQVYRQAPRWPFARRLSPKALRFSEAGLDRWLGKRGH